MTQNLPSSLIDRTLSASWATDVSSITCRPPTLYSWSFLLPIFFQCALLHPSLWNQQWAQITRMSLTPLNISWSLHFSYYKCWLSLESYLAHNMSLVVLGAYLAMKSFEWGTTSEPIFLRDIKNFENSEKEEEKQQEKISINIDSHPLNREGIINIFCWTFIHIFSVRGLEFNWGPKKINKKQINSKELIYRIFKQIIILILSLSFLLISSEISKRFNNNNQDQNLLTLLGIPKFKGINLILNLIENLAFGHFGFSIFEIWSCFLSLLTTLIHNFLLKFHPKKKFFLITLFNPLFSPPAIKPIFDSKSLLQLWSSQWHQYFRRTFIVCGSIPIVWLAKKFNLSKTGIRIFGLLGTFTISAVFHEYLFMTMLRPPHPQAYTLFKTFPGPAYFFIMQAVGIIIEPFILPFFPDLIGGPTCWMTLFVLVTLTPYRRVAQHLLDPILYAQNLIPLSIFDKII